MIFVTVGAQMPFDRMIRAVDDWAESRGRTDIFAQIGTSEFRPKFIRYSQLLTPDDFRRKVGEATILVAHAGMGSILTALQAGKPILVMPRRGDLRETRNDHQVSTARRFLALGKVAVAMDETELALKLDTLERLATTEPISPHASPELLDAVRAFIHSE
jgi:UDP-N-acetylglucosamine transferase subunit ALG13